MAPISEAIRRAAGSVEDFRGDVEALAAMMQASWGEGPEASYLYTAELLADCLGYPGINRALLPAIYDGDALVAFAAGLPRRVAIGGIERRLVISTYLSVAPAWKTAGYGIVVWSELMRRAAALGYDGALDYCVDRGPMDRMIHGSCAAVGIPISKVATFFYLTRTVADAVSAATADAAAANAPATADDLQGAAAGMESLLGVCRLWTTAEASWQLHRVGGVSVVGGTAREPAVLSGYVIAYDDEPRTHSLVIDDILWGSTDSAQRVELVERLLARGAGRGATAAAVPLLGYADMRPFLAAGFVPTPHTLNAYLSLWSDPAAASPPPGYYLDVM